MKKLKKKAKGAKEKEVEKEKFAVPVLYHSADLEGGLGDSLGGHVAQPSTLGPGKEDTESEQYHKRLIRSHTVQQRQQHSPQQHQQEQQPPPQPPPQQQHTAPSENSNTPRSSRRLSTPDSLPPIDFLVRNLLSSSDEFFTETLLNDYHFYFTLCCAEIGCGATRSQGLISSFLAFYHAHELTVAVLAWSVDEWLAQMQTSRKRSRSQQLLMGLRGYNPVDMPFSPLTPSYDFTCLTESNCNSLIVPFFLLGKTKPYLEIMVNGAIDVCCNALSDEMSEDDVVDTVVDYLVRGGFALSRMPSSLVKCCVVLSNVVRSRHEETGRRPIDTRSNVEDGTGGGGVNFLSDNFEQLDGMTLLQDQMQAIASVLVEQIWAKALVQPHSFGLTTSLRTAVPPSSDAPSTTDGAGVSAPSENGTMSTSMVRDVRKVMLRTSRVVLAVAHRASTLTAPPQETDKSPRSTFGASRRNASGGGGSLPSLGTPLMRRDIGTPPSLSAREHPSHRASDDGRVGDHPSCGGCCGDIPDKYVDAMRKLLESLSSHNRDQVDTPTVSVNSAAVGADTAGASGGEGSTSQWYIPTYSDHNSAMSLKITHDEVPRLSKAQACEELRNALHYCQKDIDTNLPVDSDLYARFYTELMKSMVKNEEGWKILNEDSTYQVYVKKYVKPTPSVIQASSSPSPGSQPPPSSAPSSTSPYAGDFMMMKACCHIEAPVEEVYKFLHDPLSLPSTDPSAVDVREVIKFHDSRRLMYIRNNTPFPMRDRDVVFMQHDLISPNRLDAVLAGHSVVTDLVPERKNVERVFLLASGFWITDYVPEPSWSAEEHPQRPSWGKGKSPRCRVTYLINVATTSSAPTILLHKVMKDTLIEKLKNTSLFVTMRLREKELEREMARGEHDKKLSTLHPSLQLVLSSKDKRKVDKAHKRASKILSRSASATMHYSAPPPAAGAGTPGFGNGDDATGTPSMLSHISPSHPTSVYTNGGYDDTWANKRRSVPNPRPKPSPTIPTLAEDPQWVKPTTPRSTQGGELHSSPRNDPSLAPLGTESFPAVDIDVASVPASPGGLAPSSMEGSAPTAGVRTPSPASLSTPLSLVESVYESVSVNSGVPTTGSRGGGHSPRHHSSGSKKHKGRSSSTSSSTSSRRKSPKHKGSSPRKDNSGGGSAGSGGGGGGSGVSLSRKGLDNAAVFVDVEPSSPSMSSLSRLDSMELLDSNSNKQDYLIHVVENMVETMHVSDRFVNRQLLKRSFSGASAVEWLMRENFARSVPDAIRIGSAMLERGFVVVLSVGQISANNTAERDLSATVLVNSDSAFYRFGFHQTEVLARQISTLQLSDIAKSLEHQQDIISSLPHLERQLDENRDMIETLRGCLFEGRVPLRLHEHPPYEGSNGGGGGGSGGSDCGGGGGNSGVYDRFPSFLRSHFESAVIGPPLRFLSIFIALACVDVACTLLLHLFLAIRMLIAQSGTTTHAHEESLSLLLSFSFGVSMQSVVVRSLIIAGLLWWLSISFLSSFSSKGDIGRRDGDNHGRREGRRWLTVDDNESDDEDDVDDRTRSEVGDDGSHNGRRVSPLSIPVSGHGNDNNLMRRRRRSPGSGGGGSDGRSRSSSPVIRRRRTFRNSRGQMGSGSDGASLSGGDGSGVLEVSYRREKSDVLMMGDRHARRGAGVLTKASRTKRSSSLSPDTATSNDNFGGDGDGVGCGGVSDDDCDSGDEADEDVRHLRDLLEEEFGREVVAAFSNSYLKRVMAVPGRSLERSLLKMQVALRWRIEFGASDVTAEMVQAQLNCGSMYWHGVDKNGQPLLWVRPKLKDYKNLDVVKEIQLVVLFAEDAMRMSKENDLDIDSFTLIANTGGLGFGEFDIGLMKGLMELLTMAYPDRLEVMYCGPVNWALKCIHKLLSPLLPANVNKKIHLMGNPRKELLDVLSPDAVPTFFKGPAVHPLHTTTTSSSGEAAFDYDGMIATQKELVSQYLHLDV